MQFKIYEAYVLLYLVFVIKPFNFWIEMGQPTLLLVLMTFLADINIFLLRQDKTKTLFKEINVNIESQVSVIEEISSTSEQLSAMTESLNNMVDYFKVK